MLIDVVAALLKSTGLKVRLTVVSCAVCLAHYTQSDRSDLARCGRHPGNFYEGYIATGVTSAATDDAIQRAVVAAGYRLKTDDASKRNLLVIIADDFRPAANHSFGMTEVSTPNIDELSKSGLTFLNAYSQFQWCSPSRNSESHGRSDSWLSHQ